MGGVDRFQGAQYRLPADDASANDTSFGESGAKPRKYGYAVGETCPAVVGPMAGKLSPSSENTLH